MKRMQICIAGRTNAGKSTLLNQLTSNALAIVDSKSGTTADAKISLMEIHGLGPCKLFDTAGVDEIGLLGQKKRDKTQRIIAQSDIILHVQKDFKQRQFCECLAESYKNYIENEHKSVYDYDQVENDAKILQQSDKYIDNLAKKYNKPVLHIENLDSIQNDQIKQINSNTIQINAQKVDPHQLAQIIRKTSKKQINFGQNLLPINYLNYARQQYNQNTVTLIIPLDAESPKLRLLRPQSQTIEALLSNNFNILIINPSLQKLRSNNKEMQQQEFDKISKQIINSNPGLIITDSQAQDVVVNLIREIKSQKRHYNINSTTFSLSQFRNNLTPKLFDFTVESTMKLPTIIDYFNNQNKQAKILIVEACQHDRIQQKCEDIGTHQIPNKLNQIFKVKPQISFAFGKDDGFLNQGYDLIIHCGGCMISNQQLQMRVRELQNKNIPVVNYGEFLIFASKGVKKFKNSLQIFQ